jgi:hypothetical protein
MGCLVSKIKQIKCYYSPKKQKSNTFYNNYDSDFSIYSKSKFYKFY